VCYEVVGSATRSQPTIAEMSKLEAEINFLKRSLDVRIFSIFLLPVVFDNYSTSVFDP